MTPLQALGYTDLTEAAKALGSGWAYIAEHDQGMKAMKLLKIGGPIVGGGLAALTVALIVKSKEIHDMRKSISDYVDRVYKYEDEEEVKA